MLKGKTTVLARPLPGVGKSTLTNLLIPDMEERGRSQPDRRSKRDRPRKAYYKTFRDIQCM